MSKHLSLLCGMHSTLSPYTFFLPHFLTCEQWWEVLDVVSFDILFLFLHTSWAGTEPPACHHHPYLAHYIPHHLPGFCVPALPAPMPFYPTNLACQMGSACLLPVSPGGFSAVAYHHLPALGVHHLPCPMPACLIPCGSFSLSF